MLEARCRACLPLAMGAVQLLGLTHRGLGLSIDVRPREHEGRWLAVADPAGTSEVGVAETPATARWGCAGPRSAPSAVGA